MTEILSQIRDLYAQEVEVGQRVLAVIEEAIRKKTEITQEVVNLVKSSSIALPIPQPPDPKKSGRPKKKKVKTDEPSKPRKAKKSKKTQKKSVEKTAQKPKKKTEKKASSKSSRVKSADLARFVQEILSAPGMNETGMNVEEVAEAAAKAKVIPKLTDGYVGAVRRILKKFSWALKVEGAKGRKALWYATPHVDSVPAGKPEA